MRPVRLWPSSLTRGEPSSPNSAYLSEIELRQTPSWTRSGQAKSSRGKVKTERRRKKKDEKMGSSCIELPIPRFSLLLPFPDHGNCGAASIHITNWVFTRVLHKSAVVVTPGRFCSALSYRCVLPGGGSKTFSYFDINIKNYDLLYPVSQHVTIHPASRPLY